MNTNECVLYDQIVELNIATAEEINLVRCVVDGSWTDVLNKILYARTGYHTIEQMFEAEEED